MTARRKTSPAQALTRRRFVTMVAAGSAALLAKPELASAAAAARRKPHAGAAARPAPAKSMPSAAQKEFDRQHAGTLATLKTLRDQPLPPGGDLPVVFRPQRTRTKDR